MISNNLLFINRKLRFVFSFSVSNDRLVWDNYVTQIERKMEASVLSRRETSFENGLSFKASLPYTESEPLSLRWAARVFLLFLLVILFFFSSDLIAMRQWMQCSIDHQIYSKQKDSLHITEVTSTTLSYSKYVNTRIS